jgi:hypothetical protein
VRRWAVVSLLLVSLCSSACLAGDATTAPSLRRAAAARLVLAVAEPDQSGTRLQAVNPDTLDDVADLPGLELPACSSIFRVQPSGLLAVAVSGAATWQACQGAPSATARVLDLTTFAWRAEINLPNAGAPLRLDASDRWPLAWSADGRSIYALTTTASEDRRLWKIDADGAGPPMSVAINFVPARLDVAPNGQALFVLGGQTRGGLRRDDAIPGSGFVAVFDPTTLAERVRVPLSGLNIGRMEGSRGPLSPAAAVAPDGSRYYVVHADRPLLDVVDTRAPRLERLERSVSLRASPFAYGSRDVWLGMSADGARLFTGRRALVPEDDLGLQTIDVRTWGVTTIDPLAQRLGVSVDGRWLFELDPPAWLRPGAARPERRGPRDANGSRLSVLDASTQTEAAVLLRDAVAFGAGQLGPRRVYVAQLDRRSGGGGPSTTIAGYDSGTWQELARRTFDTPVQLASTSPLW